MGGVLVLSALGLDMATSFGASIAAVANIGPGLGGVGPTDNYSAIPSIGKWVLSFMMLLGRLELFTVIVLLSPFYWQK
jgi:trk system potassium uptake protein TrkH